MMDLTERVRIARRFQRAIRIDSDLHNPRALEGFVCPTSSAGVLLSMARHIGETGHGAFTWTGPYGSGKSSLVVALSALLGGKNDLRRTAAAGIDRGTAKTICSLLPPRSKGWRILPIVGRREHPAQVMGEAIEAARLGARGRAKHWTDSRIIKTLVDAAHRHPSNEGGIVVFIDEMGKFLEAAAQHETDIYLFQQLAEAASRTDRRLIVVGILHQAFEEYAHRLSHETRDEWSKIQGRFIDLAVNTAGEEQIDLLGRAIESDHRPARPGKLASAVAAAVRQQRPSVSNDVASALEACWPLHPIVACLLGPISRRRFGQNQRSIFGFLNSAEPYGFQDFLRHQHGDVLYEPHRLWDYLRINLEPSILASPDGHRWALAAEAVERCEAIGGNGLHLRLLKTIALVDLFKERSGLVPSLDILRTCAHQQPDKAIHGALRQLKSWSFVVYRKFVDSYAVFAGSDFDIEQAVETALAGAKGVDLAALKRLAGQQPILAKRHYHETGALRWFDVELVPLREVISSASVYRPRNGTIGEFLLAVPTEGEAEEHAQKLCREAAREAKKWDVVVGLSQRSWAITGLARELLALEQVRDERPELAGDAVARREVYARVAVLQGQLESELRRAFDNATWYLKHHSPKRWLLSELNSLASDLADRRFQKGPRLHNELLNRIKPSSNAVAAQNALLRRMALNEGEPRLGIVGFPAEGGLLASLLEATCLYADTREGRRFVQPGGNQDDPCGLVPMWEAASEFLKNNADRTVTVSELYDLWREPPFGVKDGLMPVLAIAFILSRRDKVALYRLGVFQARFKDIDADHLAKNAVDIQLRWLDLSGISKRLLSSAAEIVRDLDQCNTLTHLAPIDVARGLISIYERLHPWTKRTMRLSANGARVRNLFKQARDPNKFLFDDIPGALSGDAGLESEAGMQRVVVSVREGLEELTQSYLTMLRRLQDSMLTELRTPNASTQSLVELRSRAENIRQVAGDFRLDAFVARLAQFEGTDEDMEGIASLATSKPPRDWVDADVDRAAFEIAAMAQMFIRAETFARVKGRPDKRHAMAVVIGLGGRPSPIFEEFDVADGDRAAVNDIIARVAIALEEADPQRKNIILAALAELSARYMRVAPRADRKERGRAAS